MSILKAQPDPHTAAAILAGVVAVRRLCDADSIGDLTALFHRAYAGQVRMGLRPLAGRQDESMTRSRITSGECLIATRGGAIVGAVLLQEREHVAFPPLFLEPDVAHFSMFAVDPREQGTGIGAALLSAVEQRALETGCTRLAMSVAEPDRELVSYYEKRGFAKHSDWSWPYTNYASVIMCKHVDGCS